MSRIASGSLSVGPPQGFRFQPFQKLWPQIVQFEVGRNGSKVRFSAKTWLAQRFQKGGQFANYVGWKILVWHMRFGIDGLGITQPALHICWGIGQNVNPRPASKIRHIRAYPALGSGALDGMAFSARRPQEVLSASPDHVWRGR